LTWTHFTDYNISIACCEAL